MSASDLRASVLRASHQGFRLDAVARSAVYDGDLTVGDEKL